MAAAASSHSNHQQMGMGMGMGMGMDKGMDMGMDMHNNKDTDPHSGMNMKMDMGGNHHDMDMMMSSMMPSYFQFSSSIPHLLFRSFTITSPTAYFITLFFLFFFCLLKEYLFYYRLHMISYHRHYPSLSFSRFPSVINDRILSSFIYGLNLCFSYFVMLIVMTFNVGLFVAIVVGSTVGYYLFAGTAEWGEGGGGSRGGLGAAGKSNGGTDPEKIRLTGKRNSNLPLLSSSQNNRGGGGAAGGGAATGSGSGLVGSGSSSSQKRGISSDSGELDDDMSDIEAELAVDCCER